MAKRISREQATIFKEEITGEHYFDVNQICDLLGVHPSEAVDMEEWIIPIGDGLCIKGATDKSIRALDAYAVRYLLTLSQNPVARLIFDIFPSDFMETID